MHSEAEYWSTIARAWQFKGYRNEILGEHKKNVYLRLIARWADISQCRRIMKTDLFAEAFGVEEFLSDIARVNANIVAFDISDAIVALARSNATRCNIQTVNYLCADVKQIPIKDNSIALIISDSTLDHFPTEAEIIIALRELARVLEIGGTLILSLDNQSNLTYPPYPLIRLWMRLRLAPYFIGRTLSLRKLTHVLGELGLDVEESIAILHYPHPDGLVRWCECILRRVSGGKLDGLIKKALTLLESMEGKRGQYLTGRYVAVKAVKRRNLGNHF